MKQISLIDAGKRFNKDWIFQSLNVAFEQGQHYALIGNNGSGKSTLLQILSGYTTLSKGTIEWNNADSQTAYDQISIAAPYLELVEELTTIEHFKFHATFKCHA
jgi:ABC-type multidrug transport system ATPase subunit